jgi:hypothetical protein
MLYAIFATNFYAIQHYEPAHNEEKIIFFDLDKKTNIKNITFTTKYKSITINL